MYHLHLTRNLRSLVFLLIAAAVVAGAWLLWWANRTGLPDSWRAGIEREIGQRGVHVEIGSLSYLPLHGVAASRVRVFSDPLHVHEISRLERVLIDFDKTKLARGKVHINKLVLRDAALSLPVDPDRPEAGTLEVTGASGTLLMPGGKRLEIRDAGGFIAGIEVSLNARLIGYQETKNTAEDAANTGKRREVLSQIIKQIGQWHFDKNDPPRLAVFIEGDANDRASLNAKLTLDARRLEKNRHRLADLHIDAEMTGDLLNLTALRARDPHGSLKGRLDYDFGGRAGRFDLQSSLEITPLLTAWLDLPAPRQISISGAQELVAEGEFHFDAENKPHVHMTGSAAAEELMLRGVRFEAMESAFAWRDGNLFLRDLRLTRADGMATGKAMIQWPLVRLALHSTLPAAVYKPFFIGQPLELVIDSFKERKDASFDIRLEGGFDATDRHSWAYSGGGTVRNVSYKGVPVDSAECGFSLNHHELDFFGGTVVFNYQDYPLRQAFNGPKQGTAKVGRVRYVGAEKIVEVEDVTGAIWTAPLVRLFAPKVADPLEIYRFHRPPEMKGSGVVDVTPRGRTALNVSFSTPHGADYVFLGKNVTLSQSSGKVSLRGSKVTVGDLKFNAFDGPVAARFEYDHGKISGETSWTRLSLPAIASTYGLSNKAGGEITGRLDFSLTDGRVKTMNGEGLFALEKTELFSVPMFGPLSQLMSGVLNDRRAGFERAKSAFCTFGINEGIMRIRSFKTSTTSLTFVGEGHVDLSEQTLDMTMRMNARGLLGLLTLPLRPFYGMFQFRGTGPLKEPKWENVMFTTPSEEQREALQAVPRARVVTPGN
jgi:hypothetical protein